ncbi:RNA-directed DNA polymerase, eukaryota [Tanacetum coccineum]
MIFRGKVFWVRAKEVPRWVLELLEESDEEDQSDDGFMEDDNKAQYVGSSGDNSYMEEVPETKFDESIGPKVNLSDDPFGIYSLLNKNRKDNNENVNEEDQSLKYPPGFTPNAEENDRNVNEVYAPHDLRDKRMLWDYLAHTINQWDGEMVIMGDFNELKIREWIKSNRHSRMGMRGKYKEELRTLEDDIDSVWNEKLHDVKREFFQHFSKRFDKPMEHRAIVDMYYPRSLLIDQQEDLECVVTKEEVKRAVWDCGTDKSPGPDGFTFAEKCPDANMVSDFRQISLIGSIYKIIAKILANRLVRVLGDIVNEVQSAFIVERQILDGPFILNEVLQWCKIKKKHYTYLFKVISRKLNEFSSMGFLRTMSLKNFGFGNKWCDWIQTCLKSSRGSILINGSPTEEFQFCKGLKQGDLLSPFLFILIMESLHLSFQRVVDAGLFMGIKLSHSANLSHMFYADDAVFVGQWSDININTLIHVLDCFYRASGLRMNMRKSKIMGVHVEGGKVKHAASKLGCLILNTPFSYLVSKVSEVRHNKATWVKWNSVLTAKDSGGLGVSSLYALNRGLMMKWVWRFYNQKTSLWANVIKAIHGEDGSMGKAKYVGVRTCWTTIVNEIRVLSDQGVNVLEFMRLKLGNGDTTSFWNDNWSGGCVLKDLYPRLYALENEQVQLDALLELVSTVNLVPMGDRWVWTLESSGEFSVASIRKVIDEKRLPIICSKTRWVKYVPIKVNVLAWKIKMDVLPTRLNISR